MTIERSPIELRTTVIVPTYNEKENVESLVTQLLALPIGVHVIVVDDNSPDGTGAIADRLAARQDGRVTVIHRAGKLGLGTAYVAGFKRALRDRADLICTMDADFSHDPRYVPDLVARIRQGYDLVIGSRYVEGGGTSGCTMIRKLLSWGANAFARAALGLHARDATAGFRCYRRRVLEAVGIDEIKAEGYSFLIEMLFRAQRQGWNVGESPILFENRRQGVSKISRDEIVRAVWTVLRLATTRLTAARNGHDDPSGPA
jgi:glycosyltransferase involved in cell wall biosynthesis